MQKSNPPGIKNLSLMVLAVSALGACSSQPSEYAWSHLASGEYLFAFDTEACDSSARGAQHSEALLAESVKSSPAFFSCMQSLGYFLVDPITGKRLTVAGNPPVSRVDVSDTQAVR